jgi:hypothetical protein
MHDDESGVSTSPQGEPNILDEDAPFDDTVETEPQSDQSQQPLPPSYSAIPETDNQISQSSQPQQAPQVAQAFCPTCGGGNAPSSTSCSWCQQPMDSARVAQTGAQQAHNLQPYQPTQSQPSQQYEQAMQPSYGPQQAYVGQYAQGSLQLPQQPNPYPPTTQVNVTMQNNPGTIILVGQKSMAVSLLLTFFFGPLGMLYSTILGAVIMTVAALVIGFFTLGCGLAFIWPVSMIWGAIAVSASNNKLIVR